MEHQYQTYADLSTKRDTITMITVYAGGNNAVFRSMPQFCAFKYYKLGPVNIKLIPASTMPVDPTGLSLEAGDPGVDPRDQLTPGLVRITNGEDFFTNFATASPTDQYGVYNAMMLDERWFKWSLQSGISKTALPMFWMIGQIRQDYYPGATTNIPMTRSDTAEHAENPSAFVSTGAMQHYLRTRDQSGQQEPYVEGVDIWSRKSASSGRGIFQTGQHGVLGWLPTDAQAFIGFNSEDKGHSPPAVCPAVNNVPQVELFRILLPPAHKTRYYYRMFVTETVYFKDPVVQNPEFYIKGENEARFYRPLDRFIFATGITAKSPLVNVGPGSPGIPAIKNEGGNAKGNIQGGDINDSNN